MAKKLTINCANCDARKVQEENYSHYEQITINCATILTSPAGKAVLSRLPFTLNGANVMELEDDVDFRTVNGSSEIKSGDAVPQQKFYLAVNGQLTLGPDTQKQLEKCVGMTINGSLVCPESVYTALPAVKVNGSTTCYPDNAIVLKRSAVIDRLFALRAKNSLYWSGRRMIMVDPELNAEALRNKGASFSAGEIIIARSKVESLIDLIDEKAEIIIVPDDTAVIMDDITLDDTALRRFGSSLYVIGDVTVPENTDALDRLTYLNIRGDALVAPEHKEKFLETVTEISGEVKSIRPRGAVLEDKPFVKITRWMLEQQPLGIDVKDCGIVKISDDIPRELIVERLHLEDCGIIKCSKELEDAVSMVCEDTAHICTTDGDDDMGIGNMIKNALGGINNALDTKIINAADYIL